MKKWIVGLFLVVLAAMMGSVYVTLGVMADNDALRHELASVQQLNSELIDQKDNALIELHKVKQANGEVAKKQFYRGWYAATLQIVILMGLGGDEAIKQAQDFTKIAIKKEAFELSWPGIDPVPPEEPGKKNA